VVNSSPPAPAASLRAVSAARRRAPGRPAPRSRPSARIEDRWATAWPPFRRSQHPGREASSVSTPDLTRKVRQLDNDVQAVYEMLASIAATQQRQANRLEELTTAQAEQSVVLDEANAKLDLIIRLLEER
jgi:hypothetical protein